MKDLPPEKSASFDPFDPSREVSLNTREWPVKRGTLSSLVILIASLMTSNILYQFLVADTFVEQLSSPSGTALLVSLAIVSFGAGLYILWRFIDPLNSKTMPSSSPIFSYFRIARKILHITFYFNGIILALTISQVVFLSRFYVGMTTLSMLSNAILTTLIFTYLAYRFLSWFIDSRDTAVLLFGLTFTLVSLAIVVSNVGQTAAFLLENPLRIEVSHRILATQVDSGHFAPNNQRNDPQLTSMFLVTQFSYRTAFILYWLATAMLIRKYSKKIGKIRFWIIGALPLATFAIGSILDATVLSTQFMRGIILPISTLMGGILFGFIFLSISKALASRTDRKEKTQPRKGERVGRNFQYVVSTYLMMAVFGTILLLIATNPPNNLAYWVHIPYPPFADVAWSFIGFASYLYGVGIYFSVTSISFDAGLRKSISKIATDEAGMLHKLGSLQMKQEIQKRVERVTKEQEEAIKENSGIEEHLSEAEVKQCIDDVMNELHRISSNKEGTPLDP